MRTFSTLASWALLTTAVMAGPLTREESERRTRVVERLKTSLAMEPTPAGKLTILTRFMRDEPSEAVRGTALDVASKLPAAELERFLTDVLTGDADAGNRSQAATRLG